MTEGIRCDSCHGVGLTDNHVTGEIECSACEGSGWYVLPVVDTSDELHQILGEALAATALTVRKETPMLKAVVFIGVHAAFLYAAIGIVLAMMAERVCRFRARLVTPFIWPYLMLVDGTPAIRPFRRWANGEKVIEASEWPLGVERLTIQRRDGSDYTEVNDTRRRSAGDAREGGAT